MNCLVNFTHWRTRLGYILGFDLVLSMKRKIFRVYKRIKRNISLSLSQMGLFNVCFTHRQRCLSPSFQRLSLIPRSVSVGSNHTLLVLFLEPRVLAFASWGKEILHPWEWLLKKNQTCQPVVEYYNAEARICYKCGLRRMMDDLNVINTLDNIPHLSAMFEMCCIM